MFQQSNKVKYFWDSIRTFNFFCGEAGYIISTLKLFTELYRLLSLPAFHLRQFKTPVIHSHDSLAVPSSIGVNGVVSEGFV